jgi:hypothetical protein
VLKTHLTLSIKVDSKVKHEYSGKVGERGSDINDADLMKLLKVTNI